MKWLSIIHPLTCAFLLMLLGIFTPPIGQADIYSWVDADGVKHFTNKPPPGAVATTRHGKEIPYDAAADRKNQVADEHYFDQQALESALRRLAQTERALAESLARAQAAERRVENMIQSYDYDAPYYWGSSYGGGGYDDYDRRNRGTYDRRRGRHKDRARKRQRNHAEGGDEITTPVPEWKIKHDRIRRQRRSKRERGVTSGLTRVVRAVPSPYYMGYRPVYTRDASYRSGRGGHGRRAGRRGARGSRSSGARARGSF